MNNYFKIPILLFITFAQSAAYSIEINGTGSKIPESLIQEWSKVYQTRFPKAVIKYKASNPTDGLKKLVNNEVDFCSIDNPLNIYELKKNRLIQFPLVLGGISPVVNLPNVSQGQFRLDGKTLGDIFLGKITKWNDPELAELNPSIQLPEAEIVIVHRTSPLGQRTIIGEYLAKYNQEWKALKGQTMAGNWPSGSIAVNDPIENIEMIKKTPYSIGYGPVSAVTQYGLSYIRMKNKSGYFVSPNDDSIRSAAIHTKWSKGNGFEVDLIDSAGTASWPLSMVSFVLIHQGGGKLDHRKEALKFFRYGLRFGTLNVAQGGYIQLPYVVKSSTRVSLEKAIGSKEGRKKPPTAKVFAENAE